MRILACLLTLSLWPPQPLAAWGHKGHEIVAALACRDLPPELSPWLQGREDILRDHVNDPDGWRNSDPLEGARHFLDSEAYGGPGSVPLAMTDAQARLGPVEFAKDGQVPWVIQDRVQELVKAFQGGDPAKVAFAAAILCHYVGDLNVPLHTTANYNGQFTGQTGVHARWETGLVERLGAWDPEVRTATLNDHAYFDPFLWLRQSNARVQPLLQDDLDATGPGPAETQWNARNSNYWHEFSRLQGTTVKEQLARAGQRTAQMILLAWTLAGKPALS